MNSDLQNRKVKPKKLGQNLGGLYNDDMDGIYDIKFQKKGQNLLIAKPEEVEEIDYKGNIVKVYTPEKYFGLSNISAIELNKDDSLLAMGFQSGIVQIWDTKKHKRVKEFYSHRNCIFELAFAPDDKRLVVGYSNNDLMFWDLEKNQKRTMNVRPNQKGNGICYLEYSEDGKKLVSATDKSFAKGDCGTCLLDDRTQTMSAKIEALESKWILVNKFNDNKNGEVLVTSNEKGDLDFYSINNNLMRLSSKKDERKW